MTIYDAVTSTDLAVYWTTLSQEEPPYLGDELFPSDKKLGLDLSWIIGATGLPIVLKPSAYDVVAIPRPRIGFSELKTEMPFFKESTYIDEKQRQELNKVLETQNQAYIDVIIRRIFDDELSLLRGAHAQRERMRMMLLTTGMISVSANGQDYDYDYQMPPAHKATVGTSWSNPKANILEDIRTAQKKIREDAGVEVRRAVCTEKTFGYFRMNEMINTTLKPLAKGSWVSDSSIKAFLKQELQIDLVTYDKMYVDEKGAKQQFIADDVFVLFPEGALGKTWFGTTPEESDLMSNPNIANVSIVDEGVAVTTIQKADPVNVETKVTMICLPSCPTIEQIFIYDVIAE